MGLVLGEMPTSVVNSDMLTGVPDMSGPELIGLAIAVWGFDRMTFGRYQGRCLRDVPDDYWL